MDDDKEILNFIEALIEEDLSVGFPKEKLRFRFPPEPNGYLHIGHAKAICLNFGLGHRYNAPVNLRFDDTNPAKESTIFVDAIKKDISWLGFKWSEERYASDYFEQLYLWALDLIHKGHAYVDSQSSEDIAAQKGSPTVPGVPSPYRARAVEENLLLFEQMKSGQCAEGAHVLRVKIDMASDNMLLRDPIIYRVSNQKHHRTGHQWHIYPMYDWAHGQSDYIEGISHSFCSLEFAMHRPLYEYFLKLIADPQKIQPKQREFARLNLSYTVMSKRKLAQLVEKGIVNGWDDPRMPTLSGLRRRGYTPESIRQFCQTIGVAKRDNIIEASLLEFCIREHLNKIAPRVMAVLSPVKVVIENYPENKTEWLEAENNIEAIEVTYRQVPFSREIFIEREDFKEDAPKGFFRLFTGGEVRLKNAYIIRAERVEKDEQGQIQTIYCSYDALSKSGSGTPESLRKVKGTLHWVSSKHAVQAQVRLYDRLFLSPEPDNAPEGFLSCLNPESLSVVTAQVEPTLKGAKPGDRYQFQRLGYFCVDEDSNETELVFNKTVGLKDTWSKHQS